MDFSTINVSKEKLDSDKVNYMIWRYLIESDYGETATYLQKEWNMENPEQLPFAPHVQKHALVSILNRGLLYNMHERGLVAAQHDTSAEAAPRRAIAAGFFGPLLPPSPTTDKDFASAHKHVLDHELALNVSSAVIKRPRLSNGYGNNHDFKNELHASSMELDCAAEDEHIHAYPSPEQASTPRTAAVTTGPEKATQIDPVHDLSNSTVFLKLTDGLNTDGTILAYCAFHPHDSTVLAAAGSDALARIWSLRSIPFPSDSGILAENLNNPISAPHRNLYDQSVPVTTQASALSWAPGGQYLAIASQPTDMGLARVDFWNGDASLASSNCGIEPPVIGLQWNFSGTACLIISPLNDARDVSITVILPALETNARYTLLGHNLVEQLLEAVWTSDEDFIICGGNFLQAFHCSSKNSGIIEGRKFEVPEGIVLSLAAYDKNSNLLATATESGIIYIWSPDGQSRALNAHHGLINLLAWQPGFVDSKDQRLLVSAGEDSVISIWNVLFSETQIKALVTMRSAVSALSFSPDGTLLAGATSDTIFIWRTDKFHIPQAVWRQPLESGWQTPQSSKSTQSEEDICSLCWDFEGRKIAYGINNRLAVINVRL